MTRLTCPNCQHELEVEVKGVEKAPDASPIDARVLRSVHDFMKANPGRQTFSHLYSEWVETRAQYGGPKLTHRAFSMALTRNGAKRWRSSRDRGFTIEPPEELPPLTAKVAPTVQEKVDRQAYSQALADHAVDPGPRGQERMIRSQDQPAPAPAQPIFRDLGGPPFL